MGHDGLQSAVYTPPQRVRELLDPITFRRLESLVEQVKETLPLGFAGWLNRGSASLGVVSRLVSRLSGRSGQSVGSYWRIILSALSGCPG